MLLIYGLVAIVSGAITYYLLKPKQKQVYIHDNYTQKPFDYKGVEPFDFLGYNYQGNKVKFYPYNYVN